MDLGIGGRRALVCAASSGLGFGCARALAAEGVRVAIVARDAERLERARAALAPDAVAVRADLDVPADCTRAFREAEAALGGVDILVANNAGPPPGGVDDVEESAYRLALERNLLSAVRLTRAALPGMRARRWGRIVFIASLSVKQPIAGLILSNTARAGLAGFARTVAAEVARDGVRVHVVCPGSHDTERIRDLARDRAARRGTTFEDEMASIVREIPVGRLGRPEELGWLVAFLCSERADFLTGTVIPCDGGAYRGFS